MSNVDANATFDKYTMGQNHILETIWLKYKSNPEGTWVTKITQVIKLHNYLKELQPKHILELGTGIGCATEIMALACPNTSIYTVEQSPKCIEAAKILIPERIKEQIYFKFSQVAVLKPLYEVNPYVYFAGYYTPYDWQDYDFIYVDGPGPFKTTAVNPVTNEKWEILVDLPGGDVALFLYRMKEGTIVYVNKRHLMVHLYKRHLAHYLEVIEEDREHTIFRRNGNQLKADFSDFKNSDKQLVNLLENNYFNEKING